MNNFFKTVGENIILSPIAKEALASIISVQKYPKGHTLLRAGAVCRKIFFVEEGLTRTFYYKDGKDVTDWFSPENTFAVSIISLLTGKSDRRIIELLEPSVFCVIPYKKLEQLYLQYHEIERLGRLLANAGIVQMQQRFDELHFASGLERYKNFITAYPSLLQRVPLGMLASYLGITQETLSRIRARVIL
jgi:CRP-like cAMP-binding protein